MQSPSSPVSPSALDARSSASSPTSVIGGTTVGKGGTSVGKSGTTVGQLSFSGRDVQVTVTHDADVVNGWIVKHAYVDASAGNSDPPTGEPSNAAGRADGQAKESILGVHVEAEGSFFGDRPEKTKIISLVTGEQCLLVQLRYLNKLPVELVRLLTSPVVLLGTLHAKEQVRQLRRDFGLRCTNLVDLKVLAACHKNQGGVRLDMHKLHGIKGVDVGGGHLELQLKEAAQYAFVSSIVFEQLLER